MKQSRAEPTELLMLWVCQLVCPVSRLLRLLSTLTVRTAAACWWSWATSFTPTPALVLHFFPFLLWSLSKKGSPCVGPEQEKRNLFCCRMKMKVRLFRIERQTGKTLTLAFCGHGRPFEGLIVRYIISERGTRQWTVCAYAEVMVNLIWKLLRSSLDAMLDESEMPCWELTSLSLHARTDDSDTSIFCRNFLTTSSRLIRTWSCLTRQKKGSSTNSGWRTLLVLSSGEPAQVPHLKHINLGTSAD